MEQALEALDKSLIDNPIEKFCIQNEHGVFLSSDFGDKQKKICDLKQILATQFANAEDEFESKYFLKSIREVSIQDKVIDNKKVVKKKGVKDDKKEKKKTQENNWYCTKCTFYNQSNQRNVCSVCGLNGKPLKPSKPSK